MPPSTAAPTLRPDTPPSVDPPQPARVDGVGEVTDERLVELFRDGDAAAFDTLMTRYHREVFHFLIRFMGNRAAAEDVFQDTFLQISQSADGFDTSRRFRPWMFTIAANKARDHLRSANRRKAAPLNASIGGKSGEGEYVDLMEADTPDADESMQKAELQEAVQQTVMAMPDHLREILLLSYFHQFPYKQIGTILGIPLGTVKSRLHAAVAHFADRWKAQGRGPLSLDGI